MPRPRDTWITLVNQWRAEPGDLRTYPVHTHTLVRQHYADLHTWLRANLPHAQSVYSDDPRTHGTHVYDISRVPTEAGFTDWTRTETTARNAVPGTRLRIYVHDDQGRPLTRTVTFFEWASHGDGTATLIDSRGQSHGTYRPHDLIETIPR